MKYKHKLTGRIFTEKDVKKVKFQLRYWPILCLITFLYFIARLPISLFGIIFLGLANLIEIFDKKTGLSNRAFERIKHPIREYRSGIMFLENIETVPEDDYKKTRGILKPRNRQSSVAAGDAITLTPQQPTTRPTFQSTYAPKPADLNHPRAPNSTERAAAARGICAGNRVCRKD